MIDPFDLESGPVELDSIPTPEAFEQSLEVLASMYRALAGLRQDTTEGDARQFELLAEGPLEEIRRLELAIRDYLELAKPVEGEILLETATGVDYLQRVYKRIRSDLPKQLLRDPLDDLPYQVHIDSNLKALNYSIRTGQYRPHAHTIIRAAKKNGMSRPLAFLEIEDQLVLKAICDLLQPRLLSNFPEYVNFSRSNIRATDVDEPGDYETWFDVWLQHQHLIHQYVFDEGATTFLAKADVSNFFPSVNLRLLRHSVAAKANCNERVLDLLFYILHAMVNRADYAIDYELGLPMENFDASRLLAHFFMEPVDTAFLSEGQQHRYIRWVDDILIGVDSEREGRKQLGRLQLALEKRGLSLNASKSEVVTCTAARNELYPEQNAYLNAVCEAHKKNEPVTNFDVYLSVFLTEYITPRFSGWERVLRRFYTEATRRHSKFLRTRAIDHMSQYPGSTSRILDYLRTQEHDSDLLIAIQTFLKEENLYEDVEIYIYEFLLGFRCDWPDRNCIVQPAMDHFFGRNGWPPVRHEYVKALICLLAFKFENRDALKAINNYFQGSNEKHFLRYAYYCLSATDDFKNDAQQVALASEDIIIRRTAGFLENVLESPENYTKHLAAFCKVKTIGVGKVPFLDARVLPLVQILRRSTKIRDGVWRDWVEQAEANLAKGAPQFRDNITIEWLRRVKERT